MSTWWHVIQFEQKKAWGFRTTDRKIVDAPEYWMKGMTLDDLRDWFLKNKCKVFKVADIC